MAAGVVTPVPSGMPTGDADPDATRAGLTGGAGATVPTPSTPGGDAPTLGPTPRAPVAALTPGQPFGTRYHILKLLGAGGMGAVYQAWDEELGVAVALKVIRPEVSPDPSAAKELERRFKQELLLARQVTHKNVVRIHDLGEIDGIKYITMPYVQGSDLASILKRAGKLPVTAVMQTARQIAAGLQAAHEAGIVHRDLKPANIMIEQDHALIMDFGIARSTSPVGPSAVAGEPRGLDADGAWSNAVTRAAATVAGAVIGTVEYMAPEQAKAEAVDHRADIYTFGLILYDMLLGPRQTDQAQSALEELARRMREAPPSARSIDPQIPEALDGVISRCLQPDPAARYQTTAELVADLDRLDDQGELRPVRRVFGLPAMVAVVALALALLAGTWWFARAPSVPVQPEPVSVLIADFENRAQDPIFEETLEQALQLAMEGASFISSYPRSTALTVARQWKPEAKTVDPELARLISQREGIKVVLAGSIEASGSGYRLSVRAIDPIPGTEVASATASARSKPEVLAAVSSVAARIREALGDTTTETEKLTADETFTAASLEAAREYSLAQSLASSDKHDEAIEHYRRAVGHDPNLGRAYSGWAVSANRLGRSEEATELWKKALALLDRMTEREKYRTLGTYYSLVVRNNEKAIENFSALVQKYPADGMAHNNLAVAYFRALDFANALEEGRKAVEIYPKTVLYRYNYALYAMYAGDFATAAGEAKAAIELNPETPKAYLALAMAALADGDAAAARAAYEEGRAKAGARGASLASLGLADLAMYQGRYDEAETLLKAGIKEDEANKNTAAVTVKLVVLAETYHARHRLRPAVETVQQALKLGRPESVLVPAARILAAAGRETDARALADELGQQVQPQIRAYGKLIEGRLALARGRVNDAITSLGEAQKFANLWLVRFDLGVAFVEGGRYAEALSELELCLKRRGEATAVFLFDDPSFRYIVPVSYWLARAQEGLGMKGPAAENYKKFLALRPMGSGEPLAADAAKRLAGL